MENIAQEFMIFLKAVDSTQVVNDENLVRIAEAFMVRCASVRDICIALVLALARLTTFQVQSS